MCNTNHYEEILDEDPLETPEEKIIIDVVLNHEDYLNDGIGYYAPEGEAQLVLVHIAREVLNELREIGKGEPKCHIELGDSG